jgi:hypothetical protein
MTSPATAPVWLLDIDGVINVLGREVPTTWPRSEWVQRVIFAPVPERGVVGLPVLAARPVLDFVRRVHAAGRAEIRWHTTWRTAAVTHFAPVLGLPGCAMSIATEWREPEAPLWWKVPAVQRETARGRRVLWIDDEIDAHREGPPATAAAITALDTDPYAVLVSPDRDRGLTPADLERLAALLRL